MNHLYLHINYLLPLWKVKLTHICSCRGENQMSPSCKSQNTVLILWEAVQSWRSNVWSVTHVIARWRNSDPCRSLEILGEICVCVFKVMCLWRVQAYAHLQMFFTLLKPWLVRTQQGRIYLESVNLSSSLLLHSVSSSTALWSTHTSFPEKPPPPPPHTCTTPTASLNPRRFQQIFESEGRGAEGQWSRGKDNNGTPWLPKHELRSNCINNQVTGWWWGSRRAMDLQCTAALGVQLFHICSAVT